MSGFMVGGLFGRFMNHQEALASTVRLEGQPALLDASAARRGVAEYARGEGKPPYRVVHDTTVNRPYGRFFVHAGARTLGSSLSHPNLADCQRMEFPPAPVKSLKVTFDKGTRLALGFGTPAEKAERARKTKAWRERQKALRA